MQYLLPEDGSIVTVPEQVHHSFRLRSTERTVHTHIPPKLVHMVGFRPHHVVLIRVWTVLLLLLGSASAFVEELDDTFMETKGADDIWLIKFYAPWCSLCKQLDPIWYQIGSELKSLGSPVNVGKSDATVSKGLAKEFRVRGYPAILMLKKDVKYNYAGPRTKDGIMDFANRVGGPLVRSLSSLQLFQHAMSRHDVMFVYVGATSPLRGNYTSAAEDLIVHSYFFSASRDVLPKAVSLSSLPAVVLFKDGTYFTFNKERDGDLKSWMNRERFPNYSKIDSYTLYAMGESGKLVALAMVEQSPCEESLRYKSLVERVAADYSEIYSRNFHFGFMEGSDYVNGLVMGEVTVPSFIVLNLAIDGFFLPPGAIETEQHLLDFLNGVLDGSIQCRGGNGVHQRIQRFIYDIKVTLMVERIVDKRKNKKGKVEYLVRWRGYGSEGDTWEPESHLSTCMMYVHDFNRQYAERQRDNMLLRSTRSSPSHHCSPTHRQPCRPGVTARSDISGGLTGNCDQVKPVLGPANLPPVGLTPPAPVSSQQVTGKFSSGLVAAAPASSARRSVDLSKTGIKILVPKSPMNSRLDSEESPSEAAHSLEAGAQEAHLVPPEVALLEKPTGVQLGPGEERARMGTRPRNQNPLPPPRVPITPAAMRSLSGTGTSPLMEAVAANGMSGVQSAVAGATTATGKRRLEERCAFDKRLRFSVRQTESAYRYRDIVVKKQDGFTHILLSTKSSENNTLNPEVMKEIQSAMATAASDDSKMVLLGAVGSVFCCGLDFLYFIRRLTDDRKKESIKMAETIRTFVNTFIQFRKPIVVAVNGPALGLGAAILPLCDVVWANEKAWFQTPYTSYGQTPDACSSFTFPRIMGPASANELLLSGRKLTAQEACSKGLVSQVLWPGTFTQEVMLRIKELVTVDLQVLRESKALMRNTSRSALEQANERECEALKRVWGSSQGTDAILQYLQRRTELC